MDGEQDRDTGSRDDGSGDGGSGDGGSGDGGSHDAVAGRRRGADRRDGAEDRDGTQTRDLILAAATAEFVAKGYAGARTQGIADRAGVNKAMLHYYFGDKRGLYDTVITTGIGQLLRRLLPVVEADGTDEEVRLRRLIEAHTGHLAEHPELPRLLAQDMLLPDSRVATLFARAWEETGLAPGAPLRELIEAGIAKGRFRPVDARHTVVSLIGMSVIYYIARPILDMLLESGEGDEARIAAERRRNITDILLYGLLAREASAAQSPSGEDP